MIEYSFTALKNKSFSEKGTVVDCRPSPDEIATHAYLVKVDGSSIRKISVSWLLPMPLPPDHAQTNLMHCESNMSALESSGDLDSHSTERSTQKQAVIDRHAQIVDISSSVFAMTPLESNPDLACHGLALQSTMQERRPALGACTVQPLATRHA